MRRLALAAAVLLLLAGCAAAAPSESADQGSLDEALLTAAYANDVDEARRLVEAGADVNHKDTSEQSPYLIATSEVGDDPRLLELFLAHGALVNDKDSYNGTGTIRAAHRGYPAIIDRLVKAGIDLDHVNRLGWTALLEAVILGDGGRSHQDVVRLLLDAGADASIRDRDGRTALEHAQTRGQEAIAALLAQHTGGV